MNEELCYLSANDAVRLFCNRELSPVELMTAVIERAEAMQPVVNAFTFTHFDEALEQARASEARYVRGEPLVRSMDCLLP